ncbi:MAG: glutathione peroxidase, partial [Elusimicrobia bacterium]|nr:glutathione peroxidase [Elusimicrobiota bacterium]
GFPGDIPWNFSKFLADKTGRIVARFGPDKNPAGPEIAAAVEKVLS